MAFIPADKMKALREAALKGDERAKNIIAKHYERKDYAQDLEDYFKPQPKAEEIEIVEEAEAEDEGTGNARLDEFLRGNGVKKGDPDYDDAVNDYYNEFPEERPETPEIVEGPKEEQAKSLWERVVLTLIEDENEAVDGYDKAIKHLVNTNEIEDSLIRSAYLEKLTHIKDEELEHIEELKSLL